MAKLTREHLESESIVSEEPHAMPLRHAVVFIRRYSPAIILSLTAIMIGYAIMALVAYMLAPSRLLVSQPFRLEFEGAPRGEYPSGLKFSPADIVSMPSL